MKESSKLVFEFVILWAGFTKKQQQTLPGMHVLDGDSAHVIHTHLRVFDYMSFKSLVASIENRCFGLTSKRRFYLRNMESGEMVPLYVAGSDFTVSRSLIADPALARLFQ